MNREVYKHILQIYGRNPGQWVGFIAEFIRKGVVRIYVVIIMAQVTTQVASGDIAGAKRSTFYYLISYIGASIIGAVGEIISSMAENFQYGRLMVNYYQKLINKDLSFYRDNQTGYLASVFRQYLDNAILLVRFFRGEAMGAFISLAFAPLSCSRLLLNLD